MNNELEDFIEDLKELISEKLEVLKIKDVTSAYLVFSKENSTLSLEEVITSDEDVLIEEKLDELKEVLSYDLEALSLDLEDLQYNQELEGFPKEFGIEITI